MRLTESQLKKLILKEMGDVLRGGMDSDEGHEKTKDVNDAIVAIEDAIAQLKEVLVDHPEALIYIKKLEKIVEKINNDYGMSEEDFDRQFSGY